MFRFNGPENAGKLGFFWIEAVDYELHTPYTFYQILQKKIENKKYYSNFSANCHSEEVADFICKKLNS